MTERKAVRTAAIAVTCVLIAIVGLFINLALVFAVRAQQQEAQTQRVLLTECLTPGPRPVVKPSGQRITGHACFDEERNRERRRKEVALQPVLDAIRAARLR